MRTGVRTGVREPALGVDSSGAAGIELEAPEVAFYDLLVLRREVEGDGGEEEDDDDDDDDDDSPKGGRAGGANGRGGSSTLSAADIPTSLRSYLLLLLLNLHAVNTYAPPPAPPPRPQNTSASPPSYPTPSPRRTRSPSNSNSYKNPPHRNASNPHHDSRLREVRSLIGSACTGLGPTSTPCPSFLSMFEHMLRQREDVTDVAPAPGAYVPLIAVNFMGIAIDFLFARLSLARIDLG
ncbi:unnamed protein product [Tilletia controversa]|nr:unnamed protein product [Tilletia controversa]